MGDVSYFLIFIGIIINFAVAAWVFYLFFIKKNVGIELSPLHRLCSTVVLIVLLLIAGVGVYMLGSQINDILRAVAYLSISIVVLIVFKWAVALMRAVEDRSVKILEMLVGVIEVGDFNLDGHSLHVHNLTMLLYDYLPYNLKIKINSHNLKYASLLLDIGKLGISRKILNKSGKLEENEWEYMKKHPEIGVSILKTAGTFDCIYDWVKYHHERVDGRGYYKLKGEQIPLASRMIAVADTYSAITMSRSYKPSYSYYDAIDELKLVSGTQLDDELVRIFADIPPKKVESCMEDVKRKMQFYDEEKFRVN
ncbi:MAG: HD domain-containing protein [Lachnospiraceae bacterium]|nr:HD domain-containing protein [Lachnospiraceae bacterium]